MDLSHLEVREVSPTIHLQAGEPMRRFTVYAVQSSGALVYAGRFAAPARATVEDMTAIAYRKLRMRQAA